MTELADRERRAQEGVLQFAEEMAAIKAGPLYPNAGTTDAWKNYCRERWSMSQSNMEEVIRAVPVLQRLSHDGVVTGVPFSAAAAVATLPEPVQDAILADQPKRDMVKARAKAARKVAKSYERQELTPDVGEMVKEAMRAKPAPPKPKKVPASELEANLEPRLMPEDHGWRPRKLVGEALLSLWRVAEKVKDETPPTEDDRQVTLGKLDKIAVLVGTISRMLRDEGTVTDEEIASLLEEASQ
jgi:hypothetical protein